MTEPKEKQALERWRPYVHALARELLFENESAFLEDLAQEGWIAIWKELRNNRTPEYLKQCARHRMWGVLRDVRAKKRDHRRSMPVGSSKEIDIIGALTVDLGDVEIAYHQGELVEAINRLTPRQRDYVILRFWCGYSYPQLTEYFGYDPSEIWRSSKLQLRRKLAHLANV